MKLTLPVEEIEELLELEEESETADEIVNGVYLALSPEEAEAVGKDIEKGMEPSLAYRKTAISLLDEEGREAYAIAQVGFGLDAIDELDGKDFAENPYYKRVCKQITKQTKVGDWTLSMKSYSPYEIFVSDDVKPSPNDPRFAYSPLGYFGKGFPYPSLAKKGTTYMSLIPHEFRTMATPIGKARGKVLTLGLGMGYFAFMASQKTEVESVTILERDPSVISLFNKVFLPLFDHPEKIHIIRIEDALDHEPKERFDYAFADLHHDAVDGLPLYLRLMKKDFAEETDVWIEKAILTYFRRHVIALLEEEINGYGDENYQSHENESEELLCRLHFHLKNYPVEDRAALDVLLSDASLRQIAKELR